MINISHEKNPELYCDYKKGLEFLSSLDEEKYQYPDEITNFHIYTEVKNEKELECIKSYFATQNLKKTKLILWSDYDISDNPYIIPYKDYIDFRVYDPIKEAKGTPIEDEYEKLKATDTKHYLQSDLLRLLVLHKYGGVWVDMDIIFLRDFKPILDQEYMYQWGSETNYANQGACATVLSVKKESEFSVKLLETLKIMPYWKEGVCWGKDLFAKLYQSWPNFTIFPSTFFNTEWLISKTDKQSSECVEAGWFEKNDCSDNLFLEAFSWHWHNSSNKHREIKKDSKFDLLIKRNLNLLKVRGF